MILDARLTGPPRLPRHKGPGREDDETGGKAVIVEQALNGLALAGDLRNRAGQLIQHGHRATTGNQGTDCTIAISSSAEVRSPARSQAIGSRAISAC